MASCSFRCRRRESSPLDAVRQIHCSAHGLRKAAARKMAEAGCTPHEIAAITGHASLREVQRYTAAYDQMKAADAAMAKLGVSNAEPGETMTVELA